MLGMLFEYLPCMEEFHIRGISADVVPNIISKLNIPAPLLQSLQLTVLSPLASPGVSPPTLPVVLSRTTPKLRSLDLSRLGVGRIYAQTTCSLGFTVDKTFWLSDYLVFDCQSR